LQPGAEPALAAGLKEGLGRDQDARAGAAFLPDPPVEQQVVAFVGGKRGTLRPLQLGPQFVGEGEQAEVL
jgi:hypothetical protein